MLEFYEAHPNATEPINRACEESYGLIVVQMLRI